MKLQIWAKKWDLRVRKAMASLGERLAQAGYSIAGVEYHEDGIWVVVFTRHATITDDPRDDDADARLEFYEMEDGKLFPGFDIIQYDGSGIADVNVSNEMLDKSDDQTMKLILEYVAGKRFANNVIEQLNERGYIPMKSILDWDPDEPP